MGNHETIDKAESRLTRLLVVGRWVIFLATWKHPKVASPVRVHASINWRVICCIDLLYNQELRTASGGGTSDASRDT